MVQVVTDSAADLPSEIVRELSITVVPDNVHFGHRTYRDGVDITSEEFFAELARSPTIPTTSQPPVGVFEEVYRRLAEETNQIISIHLPQRLSAVLNSAYLAAQALPGVEIVLVDSTQVSMGMGWLVICSRPGPGGCGHVGAYPSLRPFPHLPGGSNPGNSRRPRGCGCGLCPGCGEGIQAMDG